MDVFIEAVPINDAVARPQHPAGPCVDPAGGTHKAQASSGRKP
jgi:hypothetical protein